MRKYIIIIVLCVILLGCQQTGNKAFVDTVDSSLSLISTDLVKYIDSDKALDDGQRKIRKNAVLELVKLVQEEKARLAK